MKTISGKDAARFWRNVTKGDGCWTWQGFRNDAGYGIISIHNRRQRAHRISLHLLGADIPDGMVVDHLCRNRSCVNPSHLEVVTSKENSLRGISIAAKNARKVACKRGHPLSGENLLAYRRTRQCAVCTKILRRAHYEKTYATKPNKRLPAFTAEQLEEIASSKLTSTALAEKFGVHHSTVSRHRRKLLAPTRFGPSFERAVMVNITGAAFHGEGRFGG